MSASAFARSQKRNSCPIANLQQGERNQHKSVNLNSYVVHILEPPVWQKLQMSFVVKRIACRWRYNLSSAYSDDENDSIKPSKNYNRGGMVAIERRRS
jgi:hypothetical protein